MTRVNLRLENIVNRFTMAPLNNLEVMEPFGVILIDIWFTEEAP